MDVDKDFEAADRAQLKAQYVYEEPTTESQHMECLHKTITDNYSTNEGDSLAKVERIPGNLINKYCKFRGGGDIYVEKRNTGNALVLCSGEYDLDDEEQGVPSPKNDDIIGLAIKGKKLSHNHDSLLYQLFANIVLTCVSSFAKHIKSNQYSEDFIVKVNKLSGYGIAYTGYGHFGFYKLTIRFGQPMEFVTKVPLKVHPRPEAASYVDFALVLIKNLLLYCRYNCNVV